MPKLNMFNPETKNYFLNIANTYVNKYKVDGLRLDVANEVPHSFWKSMRQMVKSKETNNPFILGEIWQNSMPWLHGDEFDSIMNYPLRNIILQYFAYNAITTNTFVCMLIDILNIYPAEITEHMFNLLGSHDTPRILTECGQPCIYYGDEIGMSGGGDPDCRGCMKWKKEDQNEEMLSHVKKLIEIRKKYKELTESGVLDMNIQYISEYSFGFSRYCDGYITIVIFNTSDKAELCIHQDLLKLFTKDKDFEDNGMEVYRDEKINGEIKKKGARKATIAPACTCDDPFGETVVPCYTIEKHNNNKCYNNPNCMIEISVYKDKTTAKYNSIIKKQLVDMTCGPRLPDIPSGLLNLGATCYLNCLFQYLHSNISFSNLIFKIPSNISTEIFDIQKLISSMEKTTQRYVDPTYLVQSLKIDITAQQDPAELYQLILDYIYDKIKNRYELSSLLSKLKDIFYGKIINSIQCETCGKISTNEEDYTFLNLPVKGFKTFYDSYNSQYKNDERLEGDSAYLCGNCNKRQNATRCSRIKSIPSYLHIQLIRYEIIRDTKYKVTQGMEIPLELTSEQLNLRDYSNNKQEIIPNIKYKLFCCLYHIGEYTQEGHYVCDIYNEKQNKWYRYNDSIVTSIDEPACVKKQKKQSKFQESCNTVQFVIYKKEGLIENLDQIPEELIRYVNEMDDNTKKEVTKTDIIQQKIKEINNINNHFIDVIFKRLMRLTPKNVLENSGENSLENAIDNYNKEKDEEVKKEEKEGKKEVEEEEEKKEEENDNKKNDQNKIDDIVEIMENEDDDNNDNSNSKDQQHTSNKDKEKEMKKNEEKKRKRVRKREESENDDEEDDDESVEEDDDGDDDYDDKSNRRERKRKSKSHNTHKNSQPSQQSSLSMEIEDDSDNQIIEIKTLQNKNKKKNSSNSNSPIKSKRKNDTTTPSNANNNRRKRIKNESDSSNSNSNSDSDEPKYRNSEGIYLPIDWLEQLICRPLIFSYERPEINEIEYSPINDFPEIAKLDYTRYKCPHSTDGKIYLHPHTVRREMKRLPVSIVAIICKELNEEIPNIEQCKQCEQSLICTHNDQTNVTNNLTNFITYSRKRANKYPRNKMISNDWVREMEVFYKDLINLPAACIAYNYADIETKLIDLKNKHPVKGILCKHGQIIPQDNIINEINTDAYNILGGIYPDLPESQEICKICKEESDKISQKQKENLEERKKILKLEEINELYQRDRRSAPKRTYPFYLVDREWFNLWKKSLQDSSIESVPPVETKKYICTHNGSFFDPKYIINQKNHPKDTILLSNIEFYTLSQHYGCNGGSVSIDHVNGEYVMSPPLCSICQKEEEAKREFNRYHYEKSDITVVEVDSVEMIENEIKNSMMKKENNIEVIDIEKDNNNLKMEIEEKDENYNDREKEKNENNNNDKKENENKSQDNHNKPVEEIQTSPKKNKSRNNDDKIEKPPAKRRRKEKENKFIITCRSTDKISYFRFKLYSQAQVDATTERLTLFYNGIELEENNNQTLEFYKIPVHAVIKMVVEPADSDMKDRNKYTTEIGFKGSALCS